MNPENQPFLISHAQNREDIILSGFFKGLDNGFYVDVGANDPSADSVTKFFYESGWNGINIEPIPQLHARLASARPRDINLNIGISDRPGTIAFREYPRLNGLSTFSKSVQLEYDRLAQKDKRYKEFIEYDVPVRTLEQVFVENKIQKIDFMKVDVEGYEYEVLASNDWQQFRPQVICIEANHIFKDWQPLLIGKGYSSVFFDGLNSYYVAGEAKKIKDSFSYVETMLPTPIVDYRAVGIIEHYKKERLRAEARNTDLNNQVHKYQHELFVAQQEIDRLASIRGSLKTLATRINSTIEERILPSSYRGTAVPEPAISKDIGMADELSPQRILESIRRYDQQNLATLNPPEHRFRFGLLRFYRLAILRPALKVAKVIYRFLRKLFGKG